MSVISLRSAFFSFVVVEIISHIICQIGVVYEYFCHLQEEGGAAGLCQPLLLLSSTVE